MRRSAYRKELFRSITRSMSRFLAISAIVAVGAGFLAGLEASGPDMRLTADVYYDKTNMMDYRILSTMGLGEADVSALQKVEGVNEVMPVKYTDQMATVMGEEYLIRAQSLPDTVNELVLIDGRMPESGKAECLLNPGKVDRTAIHIGDSIVFPEEADLRNREYTVVGFARSPVYLSFTFGTTNIGSGRIDSVIYMNESEFTADYYSEIDMTLSGGKEKNAFSSDYRDAVDEVKDRIEAISGEREQARHDEIRQEAEEELADGRAEYEDAEEQARTELQDAERELEDAQKEIDEAEKELADGYAQYEEGLTAYEDGRAETMRQLADAEKELDQARTEAEEGEKELAASKDQLDSAQAQLTASRQQLDQTKQLLTEKEAELAQAEQSLGDAKSVLEDSKQKLDLTEETLLQKRAELDQTKTLLAEKEAQLNESLIALQTLRSLCLTAEEKLTQLQQQEQEIERQIEDAEGNGRDEEAKALREQRQTLLEAIGGVSQEYDSLNQQYQAGQSAYTEGSRALQDAQRAYESGEAAYAGAEQELAAGRDQYQAGLLEYERNDQAYAEGLLAYQEGLRQYEEGEAAYQAAKAEYDAGLKSYEEGVETLREGLDTIAENEKKLASSRQEAEEELDKALRTLNESKEELDSGTKELQDAKEELKEGYASYEDAKAEAEAKLAEAREELQDAEKEIDAIEMPEWYVLTRNENEGFVSYSSDADRMDSIATVFPWMFFFVAALVSLTSMTRMVEEERVLIGTYKALGFGKGRIIWKYILYALVSSLLGSTVGILILMKILPYVINTAYGIMYSIESPIQLPFHLSYALIATLTATLCTVGATLFACYRSLMEVPAALMMPAAPKAGRRILLERVGWLWRRMKFTYKVTARNLFRYKKRLIMTIVGISGCTALLLTGFGIKDSVSGLITLQYGEIYHYDLILGLDGEGDWADTKEKTLESGAITKAEAILVKSVEARSEEKRADVNLYVPEDGDGFSELVTLRERKSKAAVPFTDEGAVVSEKLARKLNLKKGGTIRLPDPDGRYVDVPVTGVTEHYIQDYVYLTRPAYERLLGATWEPDQIAAVKSPGFSDEETDRMLRESSGQIATVRFIVEETKTIQDMLDSLNLVIVVLIVSAGLLAFIVLYNLTNINIMERKREIATIKVLGFYDSEVNAYVYRETAVLSILGCLCGLVLGIFMHAFVISTVETDIVMFSRTILGRSYLYSALLTLVFSLIVNLVMNRKLKGIDMVESLKSVD